MNDEIRALFPVTRELVYLNHAAVSPLFTPAVEAINRQLQDISNHGSLNFRDWIATKERCRRRLATMTDARPEQIAFMRNTSDALSSIANGLHWQTGDNIVTFRGEFPSNIYPWLRIRDAYGVEVRMCEERDGRVDPEDLISLIDSKTRVVAISQVQYASGFRSNLAEIGQAARAVDALLVVDLIQSLGVQPVQVEADLIDAGAWACHKWLLGPEGIGAIYLSDRARARIDPTLVGWISVPDPENHLDHDQGWKGGALPWETGTGPAALFYGLEASLELIQSFTPGEILSYLISLCARLEEGLLNKGYRLINSREPGEESQIVCVWPKEGTTAFELFRGLKKQGIVTAPRGHGLRLAPHFYNNFADIDRVLEALP
ncbi:MAG: aminotransferase class V-fold PLP-dependent enzyme [Pyrinomonadaceae bacterium]